jgi:hypothetical protein
MAETDNKDPYLGIIQEVISIKNGRGTMYREEPKDVAPLESLEGVLMYKAMRAFYALDNSKKRDELLDVINYAAFIVMRMDMKAKEND